MEDAEAPPAAGGRLGLRILSALVLIAIALTVVWLGGWVLTVWVGLVALRLGFEWSRLVTGAGASPVYAVQAVALAGAVLLAMAGETAALLALLGLGTVAAGALAWRQGADPFWSALAVPYLGLPCVAFLTLSMQPPWESLTAIWLLVTVWAADTGALAAGRLIGGPKLWPRLSPKKTWAGLAGAMLAAAAAAGSFALLVGAPAPGLAGGLGLLAGLIGQAGDLIESALKRRFHAKDAGQIIPGHGGALDRLDSMLAVTAAAAVLTAVVPAGPLGLAWP